MRPLEEISKKIPQFKLKFPGIFTFMVLNSQGEPTHFDNSEKNEIASAAFFYKILRKVEGHSTDDRFRIFSKELGPIKSFIGTHPDFDSIHSDGLFQVGIGNQNRFLFLFAKNKFAIFARLNRLPNWEMIPVLDTMRNINKRYAHKNIKTILIPEKLSKVSNPELRSALAVYTNSGKSIIERGDKLFIFFETASKRLIAITCPVLENHSNSLTLLFFLLSVIFLAFSTLFSFSDFQKFAFRPNLKVKVSMLFVFSSLIPFLAIIAASQDYLEWRHEERMQKTYSKLEKYLHAIDEGFPKFLGLVERNLSRLFEGKFYDTPASQKKIQDEILRLKLVKKLKTYQRAMIVDENGHFSWTSAVEGEVGDSNVFGFIGKVCSYAIASLNHEKATIVSQVLVNFLGTLASNKNFFSDVVRNMGHFILLKLDRSQKLEIFIPIKSKSGRTTHILFFLFPIRELNFIYLMHRLSKSYLNFHDSHFVSVDSTSLQGLFPVGLLSNEYMCFFKKLAGIKNFTVGRAASHGGFLLAGIPGRQLNERLMAVGLPEYFLKNEREADKRSLIFFGFFCVILSLFFGRILTRRIVEPLENLTVGVKAIGEGNFKLRIPCDGSDELQDIAETFNSAMESFSDLEIARIVQENLFPKDEIRRGNFSIYGETRSASKLGGDYFDLISLEDKRILIIIGDVSGHGLGAALIMAMAKAVVAARLKFSIDAGSSASPKELLDFLQQALFQNLKSRRMMTLMIALLDTDLGTLNISSAGHNFPCLFRKNQPTVIQISKSTPLLKLRHYSFGSAELILQENDRILFYTDGLIEAKGQQDEALGYANTFQQIADFHGVSAKQTFDLINQWHSSIVRDAPQEDDITMIVLQKNR
ncbi:MAG: SpoIIE family protein phosphatase [Candidatus Riflebacteria bacterium]|nr:SpoIIE family protein phosphatase [Candidatus Riflebacteria bacterium]